MRLPLLTNVVGSGVVFIRTTEPFTNPVPVTPSWKAAVPAVREYVLKPVIDRIYREDRRIGSGV